jgi:hypothetical protein
MTLHTPSRRGWTVAAVAGAVVVGVPALLHVEAHHAWEVVPGFYAWYGGLGCAAIVLVSKALGKWLLQKPEGFYD